MALKKSLTLTLVIPAYNEENHLKDCLDAIAAQTVAPDEVIVVENNSTDHTLAIAKDYPFVKVIEEMEQGIVFARNAGFNASTGQIIGRIDADTILPPNWVERVHTFYKDPQNRSSALTGGGFFYNVRFRRFNGWVQSQIAYRFNRFIIGHYILWGSNMALPRPLWDAVKNEACTDNFIHEDLDLAIHLHAKGYPIVYQATLQVGVYLKRVWEDRDLLEEHMSRWPQTLKSHRFKLWWLSLTGNILLKYVVQPFVFITEWIARLFGRGNKRQKPFAVAQYDQHEKHRSR